MTAVLNPEQILEAALVLPEPARASLAWELLASLPGVPLAEMDDDETYREAVRRDAEMDSDPTMGLTLDEFRHEISRARQA